MPENKTPTHPASTHDPASYTRDMGITYLNHDLRDAIRGAQNADHLGHVDIMRTMDPASYKYLGKDLKAQIIGAGHYGPDQQNSQVSNAAASSSHHFAPYQQGAPSSQQGAPAPAPSSQQPAPQYGQSRLRPAQQGKGR